MRRYVHSGALLCATLAAPVCLRAQEPTTQGSEEFADLTNLSLEEMLDVEVSLVSRRAQRIGDAPASVYVITRRDIEQSGLTSIPELLRLVPGVHVKRIQSGRWAVGTRGQPGEFANNLLVLMDGRSVYTPLFSGVYWDMQDLVLDDIERIEVIRGPGGARWGANAVNGVINVVTRKAGDTLGSYAQTIVGSEEKSVFSFRHGVNVGEGVDLRISGKVREQDATRDADDLSIGDGYRSGLVDFRLDGGDAGSSWVVRGGIQSLDETVLQQTATVTPPYSDTSLAGTRAFAGHLLGRYEIEGDGGSSTTAQFYYDAFDRDWEGIVQERRQTIDLDLQHSFTVGDHLLTVGAGYRMTTDDLTGSDVTRADDYSETNSLFSAVLLDEWQLGEGWRTNIGVKFEHNDFTGFEVQPELRLAWNPGRDWIVWGSASRAVRTPSRAEDSAHIDYSATGGGPGGLPVVTVLTANRDLDAERLNAYELGVRGAMSESWLGELITFVHDYDDMTAYVAGTPFVSNVPNPRFEVPLIGTNAYAFRNSGVEASITWRPSNSWRVVGGYSYLDQHLLDDGGAASAAGGYGDHPDHQALLRVAYAPEASWEAGAQAFYYDAVKTAATDAFVRLDLSLTWTPDPNTRLGIVGQNLLDDRHREAGFDLFTTPTEVERSVYVMFSHRF
ncbi:MAG: TonB-dependent receptor [Planctomycetes bacterium]|nr:TonB-dependent receptor [Planctomycetota bacterium]